MMDIIKSELKQDNEGLTLYLYLQDFGSEFADEFKNDKSPETSSFYKRIHHYIKTNYPNVKIHGIKLVVGALIVAVIPSTMMSDHTEVSGTHGETGTFTMSYQFLGSASTFIDQVNQTQGNLNTVVPSFFIVDPTGNLVLTNQLDKTYIDDMHHKGIKVVPFITNNWSRAEGRAALANRGVLSSQIADAISKYNLDGVNVDIENVTGADRNNYTDFVRSLREKIPATKEVSVAVAANPKNWSTGWQASYDYKKLAQYSNYLFLMAYDESWAGGPPGPVASLPWVEQSIQAVLNTGVPSSQVVLGIPFYGRYWKQGDPVGGHGISNVYIKELIDQYGGKPVFNPMTDSPEVTITIKPSDPFFHFLGQTLGPGTYHIYYENDESIQDKIQLVHKYQLKGQGSWCLGEEDPQMWNDFNSWVMGTQPGTNTSGFTDVSSSYWANAAITNVKNKGWMVGKTTTIFAPEDHLTRAEAAVIFVKALKLQPKGNAEVSFKDVPVGFWAKNEIEIAAQNGLFTGRGNGMFDPNGLITREQMAAVLNNILDSGRVEPTPKSMPFTDVSPQRWSAPAILTMYNSGILSGHAGGTFGPEESLTRAQMAVLINKIGR